MFNHVHPYNGGMGGQTKGFCQGQACPTKQEEDIKSKVMSTQAARACFLKVEHVKIFMQMGL